MVTIMRGAGGKKAGKEKPADDDPDGTALADVEDPLEKVHNSYS